MDIKPVTGRINLIFICESNSVGDNPGARAINQRNKSVCNGFVKRLFPVNCAGAYRNPGPTFSIKVGEIGRRQGQPVDFTDENLQRTVSVEHVNTACLTQVGDKKRTIRPERVTVWKKITGLFAVVGKINASSTCGCDMGDTPPA